jgi:hypothetical protein
MSRSIFDMYSSDKVTFMPRIINHKLLAKEKNRIIFQTNYSNGDDICAICLSNMLNAVVKHTPCGHTFHLTCLTKWAKFQNEMNVQCPNCRSLLPRLQYVFPYMPNYTELVSASESESESPLNHSVGSEDGAEDEAALATGDYLDVFNALELVPISDDESSEENERAGRSLVDYAEDF